MDIFYLYLIGVGVAAAFGIVIALLLRSGLSSLLKALFPDATVAKFWSRLVYTVIMLAALSGPCPQYTRRRPRPTALS